MCQNSIMFSSKNFVVGKIYSNKEKFNFILDCKYEDLNLSFARLKNFLDNFKENNFYLVKPIGKINKSSNGFASCSKIKILKKISLKKCFQIFVLENTNTDIEHFKEIILEGDEQGDYSLLMGNLLNDSILQEIGSEHLLLHGLKNVLYPAYISK